MASIAGARVAPDGHWEGSGGGGGGGGGVGGAGRDGNGGNNQTEEGHGGGGNARLVFCFEAPTAVSVLYYVLLPYFACRLYVCENIWLLRWIGKC